MPFDFIDVDETSKSWSDLQSALCGKTLHRRIRGNSPLEIYFEVDEEGHVGLMCLSKKKPHISLNTLASLSISLGQRADGRFAFSLRLKEKDYFEVFCKLCAIIASDSLQQPTSVDAIEFIQKKLQMWKNLLQMAKSKTLTSPQRQGLFGELTTLEWAAKKYSPSLAVNAWKGPLGGAQDFQFLQVCFECKATLSDSSDLKISSLEQLDTGEIPLFIIRHVLEECAVSGRSLADQIEVIRVMFRDKTDALSNFEKLLKLTGVDETDDYNSIKYLIRHSDWYSVSNGFPRLTRQLTPQGVTDAEYHLSMHSIKPFLSSSP